MKGPSRMSKDGWKRRGLGVLLTLSVSWLLGCAAQEKPRIVVLPGPELPQYQFTPAVDGGACLDAPGLQAYDQEQRLLWERLKYLRDLLREAGAVEGCGDGAR